MKAKLRMVLGTIILIFALLMFGLLALSGCAAEYQCPNAPKVVAKFSVGEKVAFVRSFEIIGRRSFEIVGIKRGDIATVQNISYYGGVVLYTLHIEKISTSEDQFRPTYAHFVPECEIEALIYPDKSLAPSER